MVTLHGDAWRLAAAARPKSALGVRLAYAVASTLAGTALAAFEWRGDLSPAAGYALLLGALANVLLVVFADRPAFLALATLPFALMSAAAVPALFIALALYAATASRRAALVASGIATLVTCASFLARETVYVVNDACWSIVLSLVVAVAVALSFPWLPGMRTEAWRPAGPAKLNDGQREWLSRQIHDRVGRRLALLSLHAKVLAAHEPTSRTGVLEQLEHMEQQVEGAFRDLHELIDRVAGRTHGADADELGGLSLRDLVEHIRGLGGDVRLTIDRAVDEVDADARDLAFTVAQEGLVNAVKHAGPGPVTVDIRHPEPGEVVTVVVRSPLAPVAQHPPGRGSGLTMLAQQVGLAGGTFSTSFDRQEFVLAVSVPVAVGR